MLTVTERPRRKRLSWESRCEIVAKVRIEGMSAQVAAECDVGLMRGRVLGGSSTTNASAAVRGQPASFDAWGPGWTWDDCLPALRSIETDVQFGGADYHGADGPIRIRRLSYGAIDDAFAAACAAAGHGPAPDHNAPGAFGIGPWPTNRTDDGGRMGTLVGVACACAAWTT